MQNYISKFSYQDRQYGFLELTDPLKRRALELVGEVDSDDNRYEAAVLIFDCHEGLCAYVTHYPSYEMFHQISLSDLRNSLKLSDDLELEDHWITNPELECDWDFVVELCQSEIIDRIV